MRIRNIATSGLLSALYLFALVGCISQMGLRRFATFPEPVPQQDEAMTVLDDGAIVYAKDRLEISLQVLDDRFLNRQFAADSRKGAESTNPYTYGNWKPWGQDWTPERFTVVLLKVKNYEYPKIFIDPTALVLTTSNNRVYNALDRDSSKITSARICGLMPAAIGCNSPRIHRTCSTARLVYPPIMSFRPREEEGYIVFPVLHKDVSNFTVNVPDMAVRFDYKGDPVETIDLAFKFQREIYHALHPRAETP